MRITICAIIKDELDYLEEWIKYNLSIGFTDIHLYEDIGSLSHKSITDKYNLVYLHLYSNINISNHDHKQLNLFDYFIKNYLNKYDWCAFIDPDEYIRFDDNYTLIKLLSEYNNYSSIRLWWKMFGSNRHLTKPIGNIQDNYITWSEPLFLNRNKWFFKSIVNFHKKILNIDVHKFKNGIFLNGSNRIFNEPYYHKSWIDHYFTKSFEDWTERFTKRGDVVPNNRKFNEFFLYNHDFNTIFLLYNNIDINNKLIELKSKYSNYIIDPINLSDYKINDLILPFMSSIIKDTDIVIIDKSVNDDNIIKLFNKYE